MERHFTFNLAARIGWAINGAVTLGCLIAYFVVNGKELTLTLYIPLDFCLNISKAAFFFWQYY